MNRRRNSDDPHERARTLLDEWGSPYEAMRHGKVGAESEAEHYGTRIDRGGFYSNPTLQTVMNREDWEQLDSAVRMLPKAWQRALFRQYVLGMSDRKAADKSSMDRDAWVRIRDSAHMLFLGRYDERRRLARGDYDGKIDGYEERRKRTA